MTVHLEEIKNRLIPIGLDGVCLLRYLMQLSSFVDSTDLYSKTPLTGFGPVFRRVTALAGSWEEVIAEIECKVDSELSHR